RERRSDSAGAQSAARRPGGRGRRSRRPRGERGQGSGMGSVARDARDRQVPRLADRHAHGARSVDPIVAPDVDVVELARAPADIDSTTGWEADAGLWLARYLRERGFSVVEQRVDSARFNIVATIGEPAVVLSTHFDCVPPFFPSRVEGSRLYGR